MHSKDTMKCQTPLPQAGYNIWTLLLDYERWEAHMLEDQPGSGHARHRLQCHSRIVDPHSMRLDLVTSVPKLHAANQLDPMGFHPR